MLVKQTIIGYHDDKNKEASSNKSVLSLEFGVCFLLLLVLLSLVAKKKQRAKLGTSIFLIN
jgi:hypothetical protein